MWYLSLRNTAVTTAGIQSRDPQVGIYGIDLTNTLVDDDALPIIGKLPNMRSIELRGTKVKGSTLKSLRGSALHALNLSDTPLEEKYLADLLPPDGAKGTELNQVTISNLGLANVPLSEKGLRVVSKIRSLTHINVSGSKPNQDALSRLDGLSTVQSMTVDAKHLGDQGLSVRPHINLHLVYRDDTPVSEIGEHAQAILQTRSRNSDSGVIIDGFTLTLDSTKEIMQLMNTWNHSLQLTNAILPDGTKRDFNHATPFEVFAREQFGIEPTTVLD